MLDVYTLKRPRKNPVPISITQFVVLKYHLLIKGNQSILAKKKKKKSGRKYRRKA